MILCGDRGPGKTQIATYWGLLFQFPRYYKAHGLISTIRGQFSDDPDIRAEASKTLNSAKVCQYLVIDEFSELAGSDYEKRELTHLIDCRYDALKTTVIVTNQPKDKIGQEVGRSIVSRASEVGGVVHCDWPSYRAPA
jgi:DNA replication protein DnaC